MTKTIVHEFAFDHPPSVVWEYLTDSELLAQWLMPNDFKPIVGHQFHFDSKPKIQLGFDGRIYCEILEIVPYSKLVYSWRGGLGRKNPSLDSIVEWTLRETEQGCLLRLEHRGFRGAKNYLAYLIMNKGWIKIARRLKKQIADRQYEQQ